MSGMYKQFATNKNLEQTGVAVDYGSFRITIARAGGANKAFEKMLEGKLRPYRRAIQTGTADKEVINALTQDVFVQTCMKAWEVNKGTRDKPEWVPGIEGPDGELLEFNAKNVVDTFAALPDLWNDIQEQAVSNTLFQIGAREEDAKN